MPSSIGQIINQYLFGVPLQPLKVENGTVDHRQWTNFLKVLAAFTCSYTSGSFTATLNGASSVTGTINYRIIGNMAYIVIPSSIIGASGGTVFTILGIPTQLVTASSQTVAGIAVEDNSVLTNVANLTTGTANTWTLGKALSGGASGWTAANNKGILAQQFSFPLD